MQDFFGMAVPERQDESNDAGFSCVGQDIRLFYTIGGMELKSIQGGIVVVVRRFRTPNPFFLFSNVVHLYD